MTSRTRYFILIALAPGLPETGQELVDFVRQNQYRTPAKRRRTIAAASRNRERNRKIGGDEKVMPSNPAAKR